MEIDTADPAFRAKVLKLRAEGLGSRRIARELALTVGQASGLIHRLEGTKVRNGRPRLAPPAIAKAGAF